VPHYAALLAALAVTLIAGFIDWRERRIPNWLCLSGLLLGLLLTPFSESWRGFVLALLIHLPLYLLRASGGGDLKLMAALGALLGPDQWLRFFVCNAILGGVVAIGFVLSRGSARETIRRIGFVLRSLFRARAPYQDDPSLDIRHAQARTLPRGTIAAVAMILYAGYKLTA
jgi:prepilin peptidase CpaA